MPELPEVETTRAGIEPHLIGRTVAKVVIRNRRLRWPIPETLSPQLTGHRINAVSRRGKYIILTADSGHAILHLGMSGSLRLVDADEAARKHDHVDLVLDDGKALRLHDPRRFGCLLWTREDPLQHELLASLGPEPLSEAFTPDYLHGKARGRRSAIKGLIMDARIVVGVGNIYANEALFRAGIHPGRAAGRISKTRYKRLVQAIVEVLGEAILQGGTTLRDFVNSEGRPGYFQQTLSVYGREDEPCPACGTKIHCIQLAQRSTYYCGQCQR